MSRSAAAVSVQQPHGAGGFHRFLVDGVDQRRLHRHPTVPDRCGDQGGVHRRQLHLTEPRGAPGEAEALVGDLGARLLQRLIEDGPVEEEALRGPAQLLAVQVLHGHLGEHHVRALRHRHAEREAAAIQVRLVLEQLAHQPPDAAVVAGLVVGVHALLQQRGAGDDLEDGGGGIDLLGHRALADLGHRQDLAGLRVERHHRRPHRPVHAQQLFHLPLQLGLDGEADLLALGGPGQIRVAGQLRRLPERQSLRVVHVLHHRVGGRGRDLVDLRGVRRDARVHLRLGLPHRVGDVRGVQLVGLSHRVEGHALPHVGGGRSLAGTGLGLLRASGESECRRHASGGEMCRFQAESAARDGGHLEEHRTGECSRRKFAVDGSAPRINLRAPCSLPWMA